MFNEISISAADKERCALIDSPRSIEQAFSPETLDRLHAFRSREIDNLIIHGLPVPEGLSDTPTEIKQEVQRLFPAYILESIAAFLGQVSEKGIEHTIRFRMGEAVNEETWHGHYQYRFSVFYCLRGDPNAKTYFFSANRFVRDATAKMQEALLTPREYVVGKTPFSLMAREDTGYRISEQIYDRSDLERYIKDLDLPDVIKALRKLSVEDADGSDAVRYLLGTLSDPTQWISYVAGDIAMYDESCTMRFSPSYKPGTEKRKDRWILSLSVKNDPR